MERIGNDGLREPLLPKSSSTELHNVADSVRAELIQDLKSDNLDRKTLSSCNLRMVLGIAVGVVVGFAVLAMVGGAVLASHGALGAALGIVAIKLAAGSSIAGHAILGGGAAGALLAKAISACSVALVFLGGGKIGGYFFNKGEIEQSEKLLKSQAVESLIDNSGIKISEKEIEEHIQNQQATILSSQAGRGFKEVGRKFKLHYSGIGDALLKIVKFFGHFWTSVPSASLKAISDRKQYDKYSKNVAAEEQWKLHSCGDNPSNKENLNQLNSLRKTQIERLVFRTAGVELAYEEAPEVQIIDRNIAKLEVLKNKSDKDQHPGIDKQIARELEKKSLLIKERTNSDPSIFAKDSSAPIRSLFSINSDISKLEGLSDEQKGQILEAVSILIRQNPEGTDISKINILITNLKEGIVSLAQPLERSPHWQTREAVVNYAQDFAAEELSAENLAAKKFEPKISDVKAPMTTSSGYFLTLRALDVFISFVHLIPIPGSSGIAALLTAYSVKVEKKGEGKTSKKVAAVAANTLANTASASTKP
jgi:hypothetical protein